MQRYHTYHLEVAHERPEGVLERGRLVFLHRTPRANANMEDSVLSSAFETIANRTIVPSKAAPQRKSGRPVCSVHTTTIRFSISTTVTEIRDSQAHADRAYPSPGVALDDTPQQEAPVLADGGDDGQDYRQRRANHCSDPPTHPRMRHAQAALPLVSHSGHCYMCCLRVWRGTVEAAADHVRVLAHVEREELVKALEAGCLDDAGAGLAGVGGLLGGHGGWRVATDAGALIAGTSVAKNGVCTWRYHVTRATEGRGLGPCLPR